MKHVLRQAAYLLRECRRVHYKDRNTLDWLKKNRNKYKKKEKNSIDRFLVQTLGTYKITKSRQFGENKKKNIEGQEEHEEE